MVPTVWVTKQISEIPASTSEATLITLATFNCNQDILLRLTQEY